MKVIGETKEYTAMLRTLMGIVGLVIMTYYT
jgi:hypothetical protein